MKLFPYMKHPKICSGMHQSWLRKHPSQADRREYIVHPRKEMCGYSSAAREWPWQAEFATSQPACREFCSDQFRQIKTLAVQRSRQYLGREFAERHLVLVRKTSAVVEATLQSDLSHRGIDVGVLKHHPRLVQTDIPHELRRRLASLLLELTKKTSCTYVCDARQFDDINLLVPVRLHVFRRNSDSGSRRRYRLA